MPWHAYYRQWILSSIKGQLTQKLGTGFYALRRFLAQIRSTPPTSITMFTTLAVATALVGFHTSFATDNMTDLTDYHCPDSFIGLVIIPLLNLEVGPIQAAWQNKMDICIAMTIGKCVQTALLVIPLILFISWGMGVDDMTLAFDAFIVTCLLGSCLYVNLLIVNGKSN